MEQINKKIKKEIRLTFYTNNEDDKKLYDVLSGYKQPGREIKQILLDNINKNDTKNMNIETLKLIEKLTDKIDNMKFAHVASDVYDASYKKVEFETEISVDDLDDLDF